MESLRERDMCVEQAFAKFLDVSLYNHRIFSEKCRTTTKEKQLRGIDITVSISDLNLKEIYIDEKAQLDKKYIGHPLPTFAFELSFINKLGKIQDGWLIDKQKYTQYYLLNWIIDADNKNNLTYKDFNETSFCLIEKNKLLKYLSDKKYDREALKTKAELIRKEGNFGKIDKKESNDFYFYYSKHLKEQPINLIIKKELLICLSVFYGEIKKNIKDKVYHIDFYINDKEKKSG